MVTGVRDRRLRMQHAERRVGLVGRYADEEFGQDAAERVQVGARTDRGVAEGLFRGQVGGVPRVSPVTVNRGRSASTTAATPTSSTLP